MSVEELRDFRREVAEDVGEKYRAGRGFQVLTSKICNTLKKGMDKYMPLLEKERRGTITAAEKRTKGWFEELFTRLLVYWATYGPPYHVRVDNRDLTITDPDDKIKMWGKINGQSTNLSKGLVEDLCGLIGPSYWMSLVPSDVTKMVIEYIQDSPMALGNFVSSDLEVDRLYRESQASRNAIIHAMTNIVRVFDRTSIYPIFTYNNQMLFRCNKSKVELKKDVFEKLGINGLYDYILDLFTQKVTMTNMLELDTTVSKQTSTLNSVPFLGIFEILAEGRIIKVRCDTESDVITFFNVIFGVFMSNRQASKPCGLLIPRRLTTEDRYKSELIASMFTLNLPDASQDVLNPMVFTSVMANIDEDAVMYGRNAITECILASLCTFDSIAKYTLNSERIAKWIKYSASLLQSEVSLYSKDVSRSAELGWNVAILEQVTQFDNIQSLNVIPLVQKIKNSTSVVSRNGNTKVYDLANGILGSKLFVDEQLYFLMVDDPFSVPQILNEITRLINS